MTEIIDIKALTPHLITRRRGFEAYKNLVERIKSDDIEIVLTDAKVLSSSFLDELIRRIEMSDYSLNVTFLVDDPAIENKLARIAGVRNIDLKIRTAATKSKSVKRKQFISHTPEFVVEKE